MRTVTGFLALALLAGGGAMAQPRVTPEGRWLSYTGNVEVTIQPCGTALCGDVSKVMANNAMQASGGSSAPPPTIGLRVFSDLHADGDGWQGHIFNREDGKTYDCRIALKTADAMDVRVYVGAPAFGKTFVWRRVGA